VHGASTFRVWGEEGKGREKVLGAKLMKTKDPVRVEPVRVVEDVVLEVKG